MNWKEFLKPNLQKLKETILFVFLFYILISIFFFLGSGVIDGDWAVDKFYVEHLSQLTTSEADCERLPSGVTWDCPGGEFDFQIILTWILILLTAYIVSCYKTLLLVQIPNSKKKIIYRLLGICIGIGFVLFLIVIWAINN